MRRLTDRIDQVIAGIGPGGTPESGSSNSRAGTLGRREAFAALQQVFGLLKRRKTLSESELGRFMDMVTLVLLVYPRGMRIRISGARQAANAREERLEFNDIYEAALNRTIDFLARNFHTHLEEYEPQQYLRAALRALAKEYGRAREIRSESVEVDSLLERSALDEESGTGGSTNDEVRMGNETPSSLSRSSLAPLVPDAPAHPDRYEYVLTWSRGSGVRGQGVGADPRSPIPDPVPEGVIFYNWFVGSLSRRELAELYHLDPAAVDQAILDVARTGFEQGRLFPLIQSLVHLQEDGDILWLALKGLSGEQIGQKVALSHWVVYKRLASVRKRFARLKELGPAGRAFGEWLCGVKPELGATDEVRQVLHEYGAELGLVETECSDRVV